VERAGHAAGAESRLSASLGGVRGKLPHTEGHLSFRTNWLRAAVLGANDGILSTSSLVLGVAASGASRSAIVTAGIAGLVAGAGSMAAGEYVSVSSQRDTEEADLRLEARELSEDPKGEHAELAGIYEGRGLPPELAAEVAAALMDHDALEAHARDELGLPEDRRARPLQAAGASALSFASGAVLPLLAIGLFGSSIRIVACVVVTILALAGLGTLGARLGGAPEIPALVRVVFWGVIAMGATAAIGALVGSAV
jgi:VIT1/CCC1 family predicted Fe2+/Mn2+ transporter